uniref:Uncharacterized protein n=1 Tax=viral metagenome TaxID=1070528 RepID=A0A6C0I066_9ZZZZ
MNSTTQFSNFDAELLLNGDYSQLKNWQHGKGNSIYISWVPDEMTEYVATDFFNYLGEIDRVEFAPLKTGKGRMMFVHFKEWYMSATERLNLIAKTYPAPLHMPISFSDKYGKFKTYELKCSVNTRPIKKVEYNIHQLADMFQQLKQQSEDSQERMNEEVALLYDEINRLNTEVQRLRDIVAAREEDHEDVDREDLEAQIHPEYSEQKLSSCRRNLPFGQGDRHI